MAYIQINARGVAGKIECGNSLSLETSTCAYTAAAPIFIAANGHPFAKQRAVRQQAAVTVAAQEDQQAADRAKRVAGLARSRPTVGAHQLGLFD